MDAIRFTCQRGYTNCCEQDGYIIQIGTAMEVAEEQRLAYPDLYK